MDYPFYGSRFGYRRPAPHYYQVPVDLKTTPSRKVVTIPVTDEISEPTPRSELNSRYQLNKDDAAVNIQKALRGYLVRKSVRKICETRSEVNETEKMISVKESLELIRKDSKERAKVNEMIMRLLLRLDSVRGVDSGVRDFRKAVIKKVIRLQEIVDSIVSDDPIPEAQDEGNAAIPIPETQDEGNSANSESNFNSNAMECHENVPDSEPVIMRDLVSNVSEESYKIREDNASECVEMSSGEGGSEADSSANPHDLVENRVDALDMEKEEDVKDEDGGEGNEEVVAGRSGKSRELLEKMMEDNEKMMELMAQLFEKNEMQTRLLSSLSHRVEQLERAFMCERSKRNKKKKRRNSVSVADCLESTQDCKRSGKR